MAARLVRPRAPRVIVARCHLCQAPGPASGYCTACSREYQRVRRAELAEKAPQGATLAWLRDKRAALAKPSPDVQSETARQTG